MSKPKRKRGESAQEFLERFARWVEDSGAVMDYDPNWNAMLAGAINRNHVKDGRGDH